MQKATIIIAFKDSCNYRQKNFNFIVSLISRLNIPLIVSEQIYSDSKKELKIYKGEKFTHISYYSDRPFHKSKLYNLASEQSDTEYLWFLDADVILPFDKIIDLISNQQLIRPMGDVHLLDENRSDLILNNRSINFPDQPPCRFFGKHSFIVKKEDFIRCKMFDEKFVGWGWEDLDFVQTRANKLEPFVFEHLVGYHLYHPTALKMNERDNYNIYLNNRNSRKSLSICLCLEKFSDFDSIFFKKIVNEHELLKQVIDFNILILGDSKKFTSWFKSFYQNHLFSKYICLFGLDSKLEKETDKANTCCYVSQGVSFIYLNNSVGLPKNFIQKCLSAFKNKKIKVFFDSNENYFAFKKSFFNDSNGFNDSLSFLDAQKELSSKSGLNLKCNDVNYGDRLNLKYFDLNLDDFISF